MSLLQRVRVNLVDLRRFGPSVWARHLARLKSNRLASIRVSDVGPVVVRAGESDMASVRAVFVEREYELSGPPAKRIDDRYREILSSGGKPIIVDAGANIGAASVWFSARYPEARIVAIEPDSANVSVLRRNLLPRGEHVVMKAAIGADAGFVALHNEGSSWGIRTERAQSGVPVVTVQEAFAASTGDTPFIVKIDIEGFEKDLFSTNTDWIERCHVIFIEPHDWMLPGQHSSSTFQAAMGCHPFEIFMRGENLIYVRV